MARSLFGTDGVRGEANTHPMTAELALRLGAAAGVVLRRDVGTHRVVIGKDTRNSSYMFESALTAGFASTGMDVLLLGPVPTPAVGMLTRSMRADAGVMISASHNAYKDNGIKFFGREGFKLRDETESKIEEVLEQGCDLAPPEKIGKARRIDDGLGRYMEFSKTTFRRKRQLDGLRIVVDCANGAAYRAAPEVLWELGADVVPIGVSPNGYNINHNCGSTCPATAVEAVNERRADVAICLDGDADRVIMVDEKGQVIGGDQIMALIASTWLEEGKLSTSSIVASVMSNMGMERYLSGLGLSVIRCDVGDRYVVETMIREGCNLGGEQSGHIVMTDYMTTGDGLTAGLQVLSAMVETGCTASELFSKFEPVPQLLQNVRCGRGQDPLEAESVKSAVRAGREAFGSSGRLVIRKSGTEALVRVMGECENADLLKSVVSDVAAAVKRAA